MMQADMIQVILDSAAQYGAHTVIIVAAGILFVRKLLNSLAEQHKETKDGLSSVDERLTNVETEIKVMKAEIRKDLESGEHRMDAHAKRLDKHSAELDDLRKRNP